MRHHTLQIVYSINKTWSLILLLFLFISGFSFSIAIVKADEGISANLTAQQNELRVGDVIDLTLEVRHPAGYRLIPVELEPTWGEFEVRSLSRVTVTADADGSERCRQTIAVTLWALGRYQTPRLPLQVSSPTGELSQVTADSLSLRVVSVLQEGDSELRQIKEQATLPRPPLWPWALGGGLVAWLILGILWWLYRRLMARRAQTPALAPDLRPTYQVALDELERIKGLNLPTQGQFKEHYALVADTLRHYLERTYPIRATEQTTEEIQQAITQLPITDGQRKAFIELLSEADMVKFANEEPDLSQARELPEQARQVVLAMRPVMASPSSNGQEQKSEVIG